MAKLYDISDWQEQSWWSTGGTRDKKIYTNPADGELYYFKQSFKKGQRDYKYEFWSEIIAFEVGELLGFNILPYHIAIKGDVIGCISKSMIEPNEELIEGGKYLQAFDNTFNPENVKERKRYTFELIQEALISFNKESHLIDVIETIVFDALIGNSDRHQENWALINTHSVFSEGVSQVAKVIERKELNNLPSWLQKIVETVYTVKGKLRPEIARSRLMLPKQTRFAPIYDSGCSFGRELVDERVLTLLNDKHELEKYVNNGLAEIHWDGEKISHFDLLENLIKSEHLKINVLRILDRITNTSDLDSLKECIMDIDKELVLSGSQKSFPAERKELAFKILTLRLNKLRFIYSQYS